MFTSPDALEHTAFIAGATMGECNQLISFIFAGEDVKENYIYITYFIQLRGAI